MSVTDADLTERLRQLVPQGRAYAVHEDGLATTLNRVHDLLWCSRVFIPRGHGVLQMDRMCHCGKPGGHELPHVCHECGGRWGEGDTANPKRQP